MKTIISFIAIPFLILFPFFLEGSGMGLYAQLDTIHWMPPLHSRNNSIVAGQYVYLSTPISTPFVVTIKDGSGNTLATPSIDNANPFIYTVGSGQVPGTPLYVPIDSLNKTLKNSGLIFTATYPFYAEHRVRNASQAASLTAKGWAGAGTTFRFGGFPMPGNIYSSWNFTAGIMATANNTTVTITAYNPGVIFEGVPSVSSDSLMFILNQGECYVVSGYTNTPANITGFIGALIQSNNPIVLSNGNILGNVTSANGSDMGIDQSVPVNRIGQNYILIEGNGNFQTERPIVIAHYNNTEIFVNGSPVPLATINAGQYYIVPNANYQGICNRNMHIRTSQPAYMYQSLAGASATQTVALNFIPPYGCGLPDTIDNISFVDMIGTTNYTGGVFAFTEAGATLKINGVVQTCAEPVLSAPWETYYVTGLTGNITITSTKGVAAGIFGRNGDAGFAGYYAGFSMAPMPSAGIDMTICNGNTTTLNGSGGGNYNWSPSTGLSNTTIANPVANPTSTITYTLIVTDANGCSDNASVTVNVNPLPVLSISGNTNLCIGDSTTLTALGGTSYLWNTSATSASITINPTTNTVYTVTATDTNGCSVNTSVTINVNPLPIILFSVNTTICKGNTATLTASGGTNYVWNTNATTASITVNPTNNTSYTVTVTDANGCSDIASALITVNPLPIPSINGNTTICTGNTATLTASGGTNYLWSTGATSVSITDTPASNTNYTVTVTDANGCSDIASALITVNALPIPSINGNTTICIGNSTILTASGGTNYLWNTSATTASITVNPTTNTSYTVTVTDVNGCSALATGNVIVNSLPVVSISGNTTLCTGDTTILVALGGTTYFWSSGQTSSAITVNPSNTTSYAVIVTDANGCSNNSSVTVNVMPPPMASISGNTIICLGENTALTASGGTTFLWSNGQTTASINVIPSSSSTYSVIVLNGSCSDTAFTNVVVNSNPTANAGIDLTIIYGDNATLTASGGPNYSWSTGQTGNPITVSPAETTTYTVIVTDSNGCTDIDVITVFVDMICGPVYVPNAFSPNNDGENDVLYVYGSCLKSIDLKIYNRWGERVYEGTNPKNGWDGYYNGRLEDSAVFTYYLQYTLLDGTQSSKKGNISLIR